MTIEDEVVFAIKKGLIKKPVICFKKRHFGIIPGTSYVNKNKWTCSQNLVVGVGDTPKAAFYTWMNNFVWMGGLEYLRRQY